MPTPEVIAMSDPIHTGTTSLHVPLDKPPAAFSITVRKLLGKVHAGEVRVPPFQRPLRWSAADVVKLFDSILKGYPVGSLLFWKQQLPADPTLLIGNALLNVPETTEGWYIVDGQQRTTALAAALLELDHRGKTTWSLRYDPKTNEFLHGPADPLLARRQVPLPALGDLRRLSRWLRDCDLDDAAQSRLEEVQQRLLDYELPAYLMETDDGEALRGVFARLNSTGVRMRADEVFEALLGTSGKRQESKRDLAALQRACDLENFGQLPRSEVLKALLAMSGVDPTRRFEDLGEQAAAHLAPQEEATEALARTVAFLQAPVDAQEPGAGIPAYAFLPYPIACSPAATTTLTSRTGVSFGVKAATLRCLPATISCRLSTVAWPRLGWSERRGPTLALRLGGARHFAEVGEAVLKAFSKRSQQTWAGEEVTNGVLRAKTSWPQVCADAPSAMHTALSTHWQRVPLLKALGLGE